MLAPSTSSSCIAPPPAEEAAGSNIRQLRPPHHLAHSLCLRTCWLCCMAPGSPASLLPSTWQTHSVPLHSVPATPPQLPPAPRHRSCIGGRVGLLREALAEQVGQALLLLRPRCPIADFRAEAIGRLLATLSATCSAATSGSRAWLLQAPCASRQA